MIQQHVDGRVGRIARERAHAGELQPLHLPAHGERVLQAEAAGASARVAHALEHAHAAVHLGRHGGRLRQAADRIDRRALGRHVGQARAQRVGRGQRRLRVMVLHGAHLAAEQRAADVLGRCEHLVNRAVHCHQRDIALACGKERFAVRFGPAYHRVSAQVGHQRAGCRRIAAVARGDGVNGHDGRLCRQHHGRIRLRRIPAQARRRHADAHQRQRRAARRRNQASQRPARRGCIRLGSAPDGQAHALVRVQPAQHFIGNGAQLIERFQIIHLVLPPLAGR